MFKVKAARFFSATTVSRFHEIKHLTVIGAGLMGSGIVQVAAQSGYKVTMVSLGLEGALERDFA